MPSSGTPSEAFPRPSRGREALWALLLLLLALGPRLAFIQRFPTLPVSDYRGVLDFALAFRDQGLAPGGYFWETFNIGPPMALSVALRVFPESPETTGRVATAVWTGLMALLPFAIWRGVLPLWVRVLAGGMLALWPGQIFFSGVGAQDNWVMPPTVAVGALAARCLIAKRGHPVLGGLLYALAVAMRQEMMYVLFPLLLATVGPVSLRDRRMWKNAALCALAVGLPFLAMMLQRRAATGHFALSSGHVGYTLLGTVVPGSSVNWWADPVSFAASVSPELAKDRQRMLAESMPLAMAELRRRPDFHALRMLAAALEFPFRGEPGLLYWSVLASGTLPPGREADGAAFTNRAIPWLERELILLQGLFLAAVALGVWKRNPAILLLALAALLKIGLHAGLVAQGRFFIPATALEILAIALGAWQASRLSSWRAPAIILVLALAASWGLSVGGRKLVQHVHARDLAEERQRVYRFTLTGWGHRGSLDCVIRQGRLILLGKETATVELLHAYPAPGEEASAECALSASGKPAPLVLRITDSYTPGGDPGRVLQRVEVDGVPVFTHDLAAEPGGGPLDIPLGVVGPGSRKRVRLEVEAENPSPGVPWGAVAGTTFQLVRP